MLKIFYLKICVQFSVYSVKRLRLNAAVIPGFVIVGIKRVWRSFSLDRNQLKQYLRNEDFYLNCRQKFSASSLFIFPILLPKNRTTLFSGRHRGGFIQHFKINPRSRETTSSLGISVLSFSFKTDKYFLK